MATVERRPLPPMNSTAAIITEADRAEPIARANDVIDHYLNGPGSYFDSGTRKLLVSEVRGSTVADLKKFKGNVIAKQFADDPNSILHSVIELIDQTIYQVEQTAQNSEGRDNIWRGPPRTDDPRVIARRELNYGLTPISLPVERATGAGAASGASAWNFRQWIGTNFERKNCRSIASACI